MRATQQIFRVRRQYNKWVGNQTLEDYALRFTATSARRWDIDQVAKTALGATAFMALEAIAAAVTLNYGFNNTLWAIITVSLAIFLTGLPISYYAAKYGLDIDLLTRSAGFGYLGSTITSLIYASFTFIFFAIEAAILASALESLLGIPPAIGYVLCALAVVPIVTHGISAISKFQIGTQSFWLIPQILALGLVIFFELDQVKDWTEYTPSGLPQGKSFDLALFGAAASVMFALIAQIGEQVDYLRFMPEKTTSNQGRWWFWLILAGPGWVFIGMIKMLLGSFLAYLAFSHFASFQQATDPTYMYQMAFNYLTGSPSFSLILAAVMVIISQMKINVTNAYAGSIAWSNFFSRLTHSHPGRVVWLVFNVVIALLLMELGIYRALESILGIFAIVAVSWLSSLSADLIINKPLGLSPAQIDFKRAHLHDINPVGVGSTMIASTIGILCYLDVFGGNAKSLAHFISMALCFVMVPLIAWITKGRYYLARQSLEIAIPKVDRTHAKTQLKCCICENKFELADMSQCPAYNGPICSLCCSLDARCFDRCKPNARASEQLLGFFNLFLPRRIVEALDSRTGHFLGIFLCVNILTGAMLSLIHFHLAPVDAGQAELLDRTIWTLFFVLMIIFGVISWLLLLVNESREVAQKESDRQTQRLTDEILAHQKTDQSLQRAKEMAERASNAKSRYLTGISHELRTPLQSMMGYAQLLSQGLNVLPEQKKALQIIRRSGEYLTDLIEGLLDISKIEAGRLDIYRNKVNLTELLDQLVEMFAPQAQDKGIGFNYLRSSLLPQLVIADEKRLRQILINLLSNAIKFTVSGQVDFQVSYRNQVAEFVVRDTGVGIHPDNIKRILDPFERVRDSRVPNVGGTGLGLTIVNLLTEVMGGELQIESEPEKGSCFTISLLLMRVDKPVNRLSKSQIVKGYQGARLKILVVDDDPLHRGLMSDLLSPIGFNILEAQDAQACLSLVEQSMPDLFLLDVGMPGISGLELVQVLRERDIRSPIIMISAEAHERKRSHGDGAAYDAYLVKPINHQQLLDKISKLLNIQWEYEHAPPPVSVRVPENPSQLEPMPDHDLLRELCANAEIGYYKGVNLTLEKIAIADILTPFQMQAVQQLAENFRYQQMIKLLQFEDVDANRPA